MRTAYCGANIHLQPCRLRKWVQHGIPISNCYFSYFAMCYGKKSLTLVIDTTFSMRDEIYTIKYNIGPILQEIENSASIENYVMVPFNDPGEYFSLFVLNIK